MKEYSIGEIFEMDGVKMVCLPLPEGETRMACIHCSFEHKTEPWCENMACITTERKDGKDVFFRPLNHMGDNFHYSKRLDRVVMFKPTGDEPYGVVCKKCVLGHFKASTWTDCCEGALCIGIMRKDRQDGYFVDLDENETNKTKKQ